MKDWENMRDFAIEIITHSLLHRLEDMNFDTVINQRIVIINLDHATELLMKAFLLKKNYIINELDKNKLNSGKRINDKIQDILDKEKTISFGQCLETISNIIKFEENDKICIIRFHKLRNEIQHRALDIPLDKQEKIEEFSPILYKLYKKLFPNDLEKIEGLLIEPQ